MFHSTFTSFVALQSISQRESSLCAKDPLVSCKGSETSFLAKLTPFVCAHRLRRSLEDLGFQASGSISINTLLSWHTRISDWSLTDVSFFHFPHSPRKCPRCANAHGCRLRNYYSALLNAAMQTPVAIPSKPAALKSESARRHF